MPWSPLKFWPAIRNECQEKGYEIEVPVLFLRTAVMRQSGLVGDAAISRTIQAYIKLGWLFPSTTPATLRLKPIEELDAPKQNPEAP